MDKFYYWINRAKNVKVGDEKTACAYQYLMHRALCVISGKDWREGWHG